MSPITGSGVRFEDGNALGTGPLWVGHPVQGASGLPPSAVEDVVYIGEDHTRQVGVSQHEAHKLVDGAVGP